MAEPDAYAQKQALFLSDVREILAEQGRTQVELADALGVTPQLIRAWNAGRRRLPARRIPSIADFLGRSPDLMWPHWHEEEGKQNRGGRPTAADKVAELESVVRSQAQQIDDLTAQLEEIAFWVGEMRHLRDSLAEQQGRSDQHEAATELEREIEAEAQRLEGQRAADAEAKPARARRGRVS